MPSKIKILRRKKTRWRDLKEKSRRYWMNSIASTNMCSRWSEIITLSQRWTSVNQLCHREEHSTVKGAIPVSRIRAEEQTPQIQDTPRIQRQKMDHIRHIRWEGWRHIMTIWWGHLLISRGIKDWRIRCWGRWITPTWYDGAIAEPRTRGQLIKLLFKIQVPIRSRILQHLATITIQMKMSTWPIWTPYLKIIKPFPNYRWAHRSRRIQSCWTMPAISRSQWPILQEQRANTRALEGNTISCRTANQAILK